MQAKAQIHPLGRSYAHTAPKAVASITVKIIPARNAVLVSGCQSAKHKVLACFFQESSGDTSHGHEATAPNSID